MKSRRVQIIAKTQDLQASVEYVHYHTAGIFGNPAALLEGEQVANCLPADCTNIQVDGWHYLRVMIDPEFLTLWPVGIHGPFEVLEYPPYVDSIDMETGEVTQAPNRSAFPIPYEYVDEGVTVQAVCNFGGWG